MKLKYNLFSLLLLLLGFVSCQNELTPNQPTGGLLVKLDNVSTSILSRATPGEIGAPTAEKFDLQVVDDASGMTKYDGKMTDQLISLAGGEYTVTASCGENPIAGIDAPYYIGSQQVTVVQNEVTETTISCKVGNALISVIFGRDEAEHARFEKFYKSYGIHVKVGGYAIDLPSTASSMSAYFRAGSTVVLEFYGVLKANDQQVSTILDLSNTKFPQTFQAADHAIVTLTLPNPESATVLDISKIELVEATMEETIPLSWLPIPQATAEHQYDDKGDLVGTNITFSNCYPGMEWKAVVTNAQNNEVRNIEGIGNLESTYSENSEGWPYLPAGNYKATYYVVSKDNKEQKISSREFTIEEPNIQLTLSGYTSYTKYLAGDIDAANACDGLTIYGISSHFNIAEDLLANANYSGSYSCKYKGEEKVKDGKNSIYLEDQTEKASSSAYILDAKASFAGVNYQEALNLYVTGLPVTFAPPSESNGWSKGSGTVTFSSNEVKLGQRGGLLTENNESILNNSSVAIPSGTKICMDYDIMIHPATMGTTFTVTDNADLDIFTQQRNGGAMNNNDYPFKGTSTTVTATSAITTLKLNNSYGGGQTRTHVYSLTFKYGE